MQWSDGIERPAYKEPAFHKFLRESGLRRIENDLDKLRWEHFMLMQAHERRAAQAQITERAASAGA